MKKYLPLLLFALLPLFNSCVSRESPNYTDVSSSINANNNGAAWSATLTDTLQNDSLTLHGRLKRNLLRMKFPVASSSYSLPSGNAQYFIFDNLGNVTNTFKLDVTYANNVSNIVNNAVNPTNKYITGTFTARFVIDSTGVNTVTLPSNTVTFSNGQFVAVYK